MDQEFKDYVVFPVGSYWVYEEEVSGNIDSLYLFWQDRSINDRLKLVDYKYEMFIQHMSSSYLSDTLFGGGDASLKGMNPAYCDYSEGIISTIDIYTQYFGPSIVGDTFYLNGNLYHNSYYNSFTLNSIDYNEVKIFQNKKQNSQLQPKIVYYSRYIGVIRKELFNGQVWNLKRYYIAP